MSKRSRKCRWSAPGPNASSGLLTDEEVLALDAGLHTTDKSVHHRRRRHDAEPRGRKRKNLVRMCCTWCWRATSVWPWRGPRSSSGRWRRTSRICADPHGRAGSIRHTRIARAACPWHREEEEVSNRRHRTASNGNDDGHLTPQHLTAVDLLVSGKTITETAEALGVGRPAVSDWCNNFPPFIAALNARRKERLLWPWWTPARALAQSHGGARKRTGRPDALTRRDPNLKKLWPRHRHRTAHRPHDGGSGGAGQAPAGGGAPSTAITEADVALAERSRQQQRMFAELTL